MPRVPTQFCQVERAKAGDKIIFTGTLLVVPDASALARAGESTLMQKGGVGGGHRGGGGAAGGDDGGGVTGLKKLGVRELTYRTAFLACSALPADGGSGGAQNIRFAVSFGQTRKPTFLFLILCHLLRNPTEC